MMAKQKPMILNGKQYIADEIGNLIPFIEEVKIKEDPWKAVNSVMETCKILGISRGSLMLIAKEGRLKIIQAGPRRWLVPGWSIAEFIQMPKD